MSSVIGNKVTIVYVSTYPPRACGIAEFTRDLSHALLGHKRKVTNWIAAVDDENRNFGPEVKFRISKQDRESYVAAAAQINESKADVVSLQHEYGIFGGESGEFILDFCTRLRKPIVTTFHTVLQNPSPKELEAVRTLSELSRAVVVTIDSAREILRERFGVNPEKIHVINHGTIEARAISATLAKRQLHLEGRIVFATFGLISRSKGLEYAIRALPPLVRTRPKILYLVIGKTHPEVLKHEGESYREYLYSEIRKLKIQGHVKFVNRYLRPDEISTYLRATDIYLAPYTSQEQVSSGTITYALGHGRAVIATPTTFTKEILAGGRGLFCNFEDSYSLAASMNRLIIDPPLKRRVEKNALKYGKEVLWSRVAEKYEDVFAATTLTTNVRQQFRKAVKLDHFLSLIDNTAVLQHTSFSVPKLREGYTVDDNARALVMMTRARKSMNLLNEERKLVSFIMHMQSEDGRLSNTMDYARRILDTPTDGDHLGRTVWAMGAFLNSHQPDGVKAPAKQIFDRALPWARTTTSPRAKAYACLGLSERLQTEPADNNLRSNLRMLADQLVELYQKTRSPDWEWFEDRLTYDNARFCQALFAAYSRCKAPAYLNVARKTLKFLLDTEITGGVYAPIGNRGWYIRGETKAEYDQQPVEAGAMVETLVDASQVLSSSDYRTALLQAMGWFFGRNSKSVPLAVPSTGACYDGLTPGGLNFNQGAESTIAFLLAAIAAKKVFHTAA